MAAYEYTELEQRGLEVARRYSKLSLQERMNIIAETFGCKTASIKTSPCTGKWRGASDISLVFDNGVSLAIGNHRTPQAKTVKVQSECVNSTLARYNPEIVAEAKARLVPALLEREARDNAVAAQKGLKTYTFLTVELYDGSEKSASGNLGWYYVTLAVDGKIFGLAETGLYHDIAGGELRESRPNYFVAGALKDSAVDFVYDNVGHSSASSLYKMPLTDKARANAEKVLAGRTASGRGERPSIRALLEDAKKSRPTQERPAPAMGQKAPGRNEGER